MTTVARIISKLNLPSQVLTIAATEITITKIIITFHSAICFQIYGQGMTESSKHKKVTISLAGLFNQYCLVSCTNACTMCPMHSVDILWGLIVSYQMVVGQVCRSIIEPKKCFNIIIQLAAPLSTYLVIYKDFLLAYFEIISVWYQI